jgi:hypothetical protein
MVEVIIAPCFVDVETKTGQCPLPKIMWSGTAGLLALRVGDLILSCPTPREMPILSLPP